MSAVPKSVFDPALFLDANISEVNERRPPLPTENPTSPDGFYTAMIGEVTTETGIIGKGDRIGRPWLSMLVPLTIDVPLQLQDAMKLPKQLRFTDRAFIDLTDSNTIDNSPGRNRRQKEYRDALDLNKPGDVFNWRMVQGKPIKVKINHELYENQIQERLGALLKA